MKKLVVVMVLLITGLAMNNAKAANDPRNEPYPVELKVGKIFKVCKSGEVICPVREPICDNLKIVKVVDTPDGLGFKGIAAGSTLCSVSSGGSRRVFRLTVHK